MKKKLQIFISSTFTDLKIERQAAVEAILKSGNIPAGMELFTSGNKSQLNTIKKWIDESDIFLLILGGRYGSIEPISGNSYTEVEYDYAISVKKPLFSVVIKDDYLEKKVKKYGNFFHEIGNPQKLMAFRKKVTSNMTSFFSHSKDIKLAIHETIREFKEGGEYEFSGWVPGEEVAVLNELLDENIRLEKEVASLKKQLVSFQRLNITRKSSGEDEKIYIQKLIDDVRNCLKDFTFQTRYYENQNTLLKDEEKLTINNTNGDAFRKFLTYTQNILSNCIKPQGGYHPLHDNAFYLVFPSGNMTIIADLKKIESKSINAIDFILNSKLLKKYDKLFLHSLKRLLSDIKDNLLNHQELLNKILDDLFPRMIQRCLEIRGGSVTSLTAFYEGLIEVKNGIIELKKLIGIMEVKIKE